MVVLVSFLERDQDIGDYDICVHEWLRGRVECV
jgi:hypothetical protein